MNQTVLQELTHETGATMESAGQVIQAMNTFETSNPQNILASALGDMSSTVDALQEDASAIEQPVLSGISSSINDIQTNLLDDVNGSVSIVTGDVNDIQEAMSEISNAVD
jgi:uncharacterized protein YicC (UPF0701 family)